MISTPPWHGFVIHAGRNDSFSHAGVEQKQLLGPSQRRFLGTPSGFVPRTLSRLWWPVAVVTLVVIRLQAHASTLMRVVLRRASLHFGKILWQKTINFEADKPMRIVISLKALMLTMLTTI